MNKIFNRRFWKYFVITLLVVQLLVTLSAAGEYTDQFFYHSVPFSFAFQFCLVASALLLPASVCSATSVASFVAFRHLPEKGLAAFFKVLGFSLIFFLLLSVAVYFYDRNVQPELKIKSVEMLWKIKSGSYSYPGTIEDKNDFNKLPDFEEYNASVLSGEKLSYKLDSIDEQRNRQIGECYRLLSLLPPEQAEEAYETYNLQQLGVDYQYSENPGISNDSIAYIQQIQLYNQAAELAETSMQQGEYRFESYKRSISAVSLLLSFLIFATMGYFLRNKTWTKIFGIIAIIIVSIYMLSTVQRSTIIYLKDTLKIDRSLLK